jgi:hypothetical protein
VVTSMYRFNHMGTFAATPNGHLSHSAAAYPARCG